MLGVKKQAGQLQASRLNGSQLSGSRTVFFGGRQKKVHLGGSHSLTANSSESFSGPHDQHSVVPAGTELHMQVPDRRIAMFIVATYVYCLDSPCCTFSTVWASGLSDQTTWPWSAQKCHPGDGLTSSVSCSVPHLPQHMYFVLCSFLRAAHMCSLQIFLDVWTLRFCKPAEKTVLLSFVGALCASCASERTLTWQHLASPNCKPCYPKQARTLRGGLSRRSNPVQATLAEIPPHLLGGSLLCLEEGISE